MVEQETLPQDPPLEQLAPSAIPPYARLVVTRHGEDNSGYYLHRSRCVSMPISWLILPEPHLQDSQSRRKQVRVTPPNAKSGLADNAAAILQPPPTQLEVECLTDEADISTGLEMTLLSELTAGEALAAVQHPGSIPDAFP